VEVGLIQQRGEDGGGPSLSLRDMSMMEVIGEVMNGGHMKVLAGCGGRRIVKVVPMGMDIRRSGWGLG
jgi:hypothetical protein